MNMYKVQKRVSTTDLKGSRLKTLTSNDLLSKALEDNSLDVQTKIRYLEISLSKSSYINPTVDTLTVLERLGFLYLSNNNLESDYSIFTDILDIDEQNFNAYLQRARVLFQWKSHSASLEDVNEFD